MTSEKLQGARHRAGEQKEAHRGKKTGFNAATDLYGEGGELIESRCVPEESRSTPPLSYFGSHTGTCWK